MSRVRPLRDVALAISLLTVIPTGVAWPEDGRTDVASYLGVAGLLLGSVLGGALVFVPNEVLAHAALLVSATLVAAEALLTRMMHFDALADVADAWWGGSTPQRRLEIMSDSAVGAFGGTALLSAGLLQVSALVTLVSVRAFVPVVLSVVVARFAATFAAWLGKPAKPGGLGRSVMGAPTVFGAFVAAAVVLACAWAAWLWAGVWGEVYVVSGLVLALGVPHVISGRMGGVTGDVMGASVLVTQTLLYAIAAVAVAL